jgi:hypothetical protein
MHYMTPSNELYTKSMKVSILFKKALYESALHVVLGVRRDGP